MTGDGGIWLRKQCLIMSQNGNGDAISWLNRPLCELGAWIEANNIIVEERREGGKQNGVR